MTTVIFQALEGTGAGIAAAAAAVLIFTTRSRFFLFIGCCADLRSGSCSAATRYGGQALANRSTWPFPAGDLSGRPIGRFPRRGIPTLLRGRGHVVHDLGEDAGDDHGVVAWGPALDLTVRVSPSWVTSCHEPVLRTWLRNSE